MKKTASGALAKDDGAVAAALHGKEAGLGPLGSAHDRDKAADTAYGRQYQARYANLTKANGPYASANDFLGRGFHAPEFAAGVLALLGGTDQGIYPRAYEWPMPRPSRASTDKAVEVFKSLPLPQDSWEREYHDWSGRELLGVQLNGQEGASANDIATFLRFGDFPKQAPAVDSLEFRSEVELLKAAWAGCDSNNPIDFHRVLSAAVVQAHVEWESEYASQAKPRADIVAAEITASKEVRVATAAMIEAVNQAWLADQILHWQKYWAARPNDSSRPKAADFTKANTELAAARKAAEAQVAVANKAATGAKTASTAAGNAQNAGYAIADAAKAPRGRGLLYGQRSAQVAKASAAAATAAAAAALTASNAAKASVANSGALFALSQTQAHAISAEFRKAAALEAAAQAKAAATAADAQAKEAAANATKAKNAQATAEKAEQTAKAGAAEAKRQRAAAEAEKANAERERDLAAAERSKAASAEQRAQAERETAGRARTAADTAAATASTQRQAAQQSETDAYAARDRAVVAERQRDATASRAAALESAATAAEGTAAAAETRQAATEARTAADEASGAASRARGAANEASTAAVNSRAAATRSEAAAARARSAADSAWSAYETTRAAAATAHAAAAEAIDAAAAAKTNAGIAEAEAKKAQAAAIKARQEADTAKAEAVKTAAWAVKTAGFAHAAGIAAAGARDAAKATTTAANEAISTGSPYRETDASAAMAVLVGQTAKTLAEQQAAAAQAKANEAAKAAADAKALADKAAGDAKIAAQAAANAAADAAKALQSVAAARTSATEAAKAAKAAIAADTRAQQYDIQAGVDTLSAISAAGGAETAAGQADREATDAERDAAGARSAAGAAERDATAAQSSATTAEKDAVKAETAAANAQGAAQDADAAATRAEEAERKRLAELRRQRADAASPDVGPDLPANEEAILLRLCGQECVDQFRAARALAGEDLLVWVKENGGQILLDFIGWTDLKACLSQGDVESCLWTLVNLVGTVTLVGKIPALAKAVVKVSSGVAGFFEQSARAKRTLDKLRKLIEKAKKEPNTPNCKPKKAVPAVQRTKLSAVQESIVHATPTARAAAASSSGDFDPCDFDPDESLPFELLDDIDQRYGADIADGMEYQWERMMSTAKDASDHQIPGIGRDMEAMAKYFQRWRGKETHLDTVTNNTVAYDSDKGVIVVIKKNYIHAHKKSESDWLYSGRYKKLSS